MEYKWDSKGKMINQKDYEDGKLSSETKWDSKRNKISEKRV